MARVCVAISYHRSDIATDGEITLNVDSGNTNSQTIM